MWIVRIALRQPYTFIVAALIIVLMAPIVCNAPPRTFSQHRYPHVGYLLELFGTGSAAHGGPHRLPYLRFLTTVVDNGEHTEAQTVAGNSVIKTFFHPGTDVHVANRRSPHFPRP